jgi:hypothetical protein
MRAIVHGLHSCARLGLILLGLAGVSDCGDLRSYPVLAGGTDARMGSEQAGSPGAPGGSGGVAGGAGPMAGPPPSDGGPTGMSRDTSGVVPASDSRPAPINSDAPTGGSPDVRDSPAPTAPSETALFEGSWEFAGGTQSLECQGDQQTMPAMGRFELKKGADAPLWQVDEYCTFRLDISGKVASYRRHPPCLKTSAGDTVTLTPLFGGIRAEGPTAYIEATFELVVAVPGGPVPCTLAFNASATRAGGVPTNQETVRLTEAGRGNRTPNGGRHETQHHQPAAGAPRPLP